MMKKVKTVKRAIYDSVYYSIYDHDSFRVSVDSYVRDFVQEFWSSVIHRDFDFVNSVLNFIHRTVGYVTINGEV